MNPLAHNMGNATKEELETFGNFVINDLGIEGGFLWTPASPSIMIFPNILIRESLIGGCYKWEAKEEVLHEISHLKIGEGGHGKEFYAIFGELVSKYMHLDKWL